MTKTLLIASGIPINLITNDAMDEIARYRSHMMIDGDGSSGNVDKDPDFQGTTSLRVDGRYLNSVTESFIAFPPIIAQKTKRIVLGSLVVVENLHQPNWMCLAVAGDIGPHDKAGEASKHCAELLGVDSNAKDGGSDVKDLSFLYTIYVGVPANINGIQYALQNFNHALNVVQQAKIVAEIKARNESVGHST